MGKAAFWGSLLLGFNLMYLCLADALLAGDLYQKQQLQQQQSLPSEAWVLALALRGSGTSQQAADG